MAVKLTVMIPDELDKRLRVEIAKRMGGRKGDLTKAVIEALELWLKKEN